jgi:hypothetical protein
MILATFQDAASTCFWWMLIVIGLCTWAVKAFFANNPEVKDAAKKAASEKAMSLIMKLLK